ncbi:MAG: agmatine deiminase family protein [Pseudomonadota bacterium]
MNRRQAIAGSIAMAASSTIASASSGRFHVPAEEHPHELTFMQWPVNLSDYSGDRTFLRLTQNTIADIANTVSEFEPVIILAAKADQPGARKKLSASVKLWDIPTDDLWTRDSGPIFMIDGKGGRAISHIQFNGWGRKASSRRDSKIAKRVAKRLGMDLKPTGLKGEGGSTEQDGKGLLIAHESSWVNRNRNPGQSRSNIEARLLRAYGADRVIWAPGVKGLDVTDYHIDSLARFTPNGRVLMNLPDDPIPGEPFHDAALETHDILKAASLKIDVIPEPNRRRVASEDFVASYVNYYVCNGGVVAPQFGDRETDKEALRALRRHYPGREIVQLNTDILGENGGGIHCATQQMPAA